MATVSRKTPSSTPKTMASVLMATKTESREIMYHSLVTMVSRSMEMVGTRLLVTVQTTMTILGSQFLPDSENNHLSGNKASGNGEFDLEDLNEDCDNNRWTGNTGLANIFCIR